MPINVRGLSDRIKNWPKEERPREKLLAEGAEKQTDANLLAVILRVGRGTFKKGEPGQSAQALAHTLLADFNGLKGLDRATMQELLAAPGLSDAKVAQIKAAFELGKRACTRKLTAVSVLFQPPPRSWFTIIRPAVPNLPPATTPPRVTY